LNAEKRAEIENKVAALRQKNALFMPEFPEDEIEKLDDTLDYPPIGSCTDKLC